MEIYIKVLTTILIGFLNMFEIIIVGKWIDGNMVVNVFEDGIAKYYSALMSLKEIEKHKLDEKYKVTYSIK